MNKNYCGGCAFIYNCEYCLLHEVYVSDIEISSCHDFLQTNGNTVSREFTEEEWDRYSEEEESKIDLRL